MGDEEHQSTYCLGSGMWTIPLLFSRTKMMLLVFRLPEWETRQH